MSDENFISSTYAEKLESLNRVRPQVLLEDSNNLDTLSQNESSQNNVFLGMVDDRIISETTHTIIIPPVFKTNLLVNKIDGTEYNNISIIGNKTKYFEPTTAKKSFLIKRETLANRITLGSLDDTNYIKNNNLNSGFLKTFHDDFVKPIIPLNDKNFNQYDNENHTIEKVNSLTPQHFTILKNNARNTNNFPAVMQNKKTESIIY